MGLPRFRGRGMGFGNGFVRPGGLGQTMKHSVGPRGIRPRFQFPPPGIQLQMQTLPPPVMRPTAMRYPVLRPPAMCPPVMRPPVMFPVMCPPVLHPPMMRPMGFRPPYLHPAQSGDPRLSRLPPHFMPVPPEISGRPLRGGNRTVSTLIRGGRGQLKGRKTIINPHNDVAGDHYCETCDKNLKDAEKLSLHLAEHKVCGHDGCTFQAHPMVVANHVRVQHQTGLYKKICVVNNPEDIAKWIQERKNRYPTKANIERREAEKKEQVDRGERLDHEPPNFITYTRSRNARRTSRGMRRHYGRFRPKAEDDSGTKSEECDVKNVDEEVMEKENGISFQGRGIHSRMRGRYRRFWPRANERFRHRTNVDDDNDNNNVCSKEMEGWNAQVAEEEKFLGRGCLISFPGTDAFPDTCESEHLVQSIQEGGFSDAEWEGLPTESSCSKPVASKVLMSLMGSYASDQSDIEGNSENQSLPVVPLTVSNSCSNAISASQQPEREAAQNESDGAPEEAPIVFGEPKEAPEPLPTTSENVEEERYCNRRRRHKTRTARLKGAEGPTEKVCDEKPERVVAKSRYLHQKRPTFLDKLLREEIRHERNIILQCVNYVVKYGFLNRHSVSEATDSSSHCHHNNRAKILAKCITHIVNCGMLDKNHSQDTAVVAHGL